MHASEDVRVLKCLDGLHYSFEMLEQIYVELHESCARITKDPKALAGALWRCWSFVDVLHRIRELTQAVPGLSQKTPQILAFLQSTTRAEELRHYVQHLRGELMKKSPNPVWGSLSWVSPEDPALAYTAVFGAQMDGASFETCVYDSLERHWVSKVTLGTETGAFNFDPIFRACMTFKTFIVPLVRSTYKGSVVVQESPAIISVRFVIPETGDVTAR